MLLRFFLQGDKPNDWWIVTDLHEHATINKIYKMGKKKIYDDFMPQNITYNYSLENDNNTMTEYTLILEFIKEKDDPNDYCGGSKGLLIQMYRARRSTPNKRRLVHAEHFPEHKGTQ